MEEIRCEVIRDLLPLYEDNAASEETQELVRRHLKDCPACREELRKMRTPISLPPDEDEEAVRRFLEHRAEIRRKQNVKIACMVSALALIAVFMLCYTLIPRNWNTASGGAEPNRIMGSKHAFTIYHGDTDIITWNIDQQNEDAVNSFIDAFQASSYRAELRNVLNYTPLGNLLDTSVRGSSTSIILALVKDETILANVTLFDTYDHEIQIRPYKGNQTYFYHDDGTLFNTLSALIEEYGTLLED